MVSNTHIQPLVEMGLNVLEAEVYAHLLKESPLTGYGVAKALGKPTANVYKAIESLADKGAVIIDEGGTRMCRPIAVRDFLARLERDFRRHKSDAERALERLPGPGEDTRIYQLRSREQVFEQCRRLLRDATRFVLVDIYPEPLGEIRDDMVAAAKRGVQVVAKTYGVVDVPGIELLIEPEYETVRERWPGQWVNVVMDGSEYVLGLLSEDGDDVVQAVWSRSPYVSYIHQARLACEMGYTAMKIDITNDASRDKLLQTFKHTYDYFPLDSPGYERLLQQLKPHPRTGKKKEGIES